MTSKDRGLTCKVEGDELVIRVGIDAVWGLNIESEDGTTILSLVINEVIHKAIGNGSMAVDYEFKPKKFGRM